MVPLIAALGSIGASSAAGASPPAAAAGAAPAAASAAARRLPSRSAIAGIPDGLLASSLFWHEDNGDTRRQPRRR